ncbi:glycosyltransferase family 4 protein [Umezakia ovalisporum]|uniref:glycosyltransferase family 4 protein n=1 Tax=Umezakia ovalisporum TaxID=75695 RepID=UPI0035B6EEDE
MKIAVWHNLPSGGGKRALYYHVQGLVERGHYVESWCPPTAGQTYLPLSNLVKENIVALPQKTTQLFSPLNSWLASYNRIIDQLVALDAHCQQCAAAINDAGFDILFANSSTLFYNNPMGRYTKLPSLIYLQEPYRWLYEALPQLPWVALDNPSAPKLTLSFLKSFLGDSIKVQGLRVQMREELKNAKAFDRILVNSQYSRESVLRAYGLESEVCYLGIDTDLFLPVQQPKESYVVGLGGIYAGKRIERAIESIATIPTPQRPPLIWIGNFVDTDYLEKIDSLAKALKVSFITKVRLSDSDLAKTLSSAAVMIYTPFLEPFGFAPLEANACGTPVVAIAEGGVRETVQNGINGYLTPDYNPSQLGAAVMKLVSDQNLAKTMGLRSRQLVLDQWNLASAIDRLEKKLLALVN